MTWSEYDVPALALMLADNYADAWDQVLGWQVASETIDASRRWLATARTQLAEAWPPEHSPAAVAFLSYLDGLDTSMADTANVALTNGSARATVLTVLGEAQSSVDQLHQTWKVRVVPAPPLATAAERFVAESAAAEWAADLNSQAHEVMTKTDQAIFESYRQLQVPDVYQQSPAGDLRQPIPIPGSPTSAAAIGSPATMPRTSGSSAAPLPTAIPSSPSGQPEPESLGASPIGTTGLSNNDPPQGDNPGAGEGRISIGEAVSAAAGGLLAAGLLRDAKGTKLGAGTRHLNEPAGAAASSEPTLNSESSTQSSTAAGDEPSTLTRTSSGSMAAEPGGMLAPGTGVPARSNHRSGRRQRLRQGDALTTPVPVTSLLAARREGPAFHDPGPGVIGIDR